MVVGGWALVVGLILLALALGLWLWSSRLEESAGLPDGRVIYADTGGWFANQETLYSNQLKLAGKPDYLVQEANGDIIPVELKSAQAPCQPHESHILQLAAYCRLVEEHYGVRPSYGIIQYSDRAFGVEYTDELEEDLLDLLADMRSDLFAADVARDHDEGARCARCGVRGQCGQRLA